MTDVRNLAAFFLLLCTLNVWADSNNLQMDGTLVYEPCTLEPVDNTLEVDFGTVIKKELYAENRTNSVPFTITLTDCDTQLGKTVSFTLNGLESQELTGYLAVSGIDSAGIAIGIETPKGEPLPVNQPTSFYSLQDNTTRIALQAFVEAVPEAIKNQSLVSGDFSATATLEATYP